MHVIKDVETGNFLSPFSFQLVSEKDNIWLYTTYTGLIGTSFYNTKENAQKVLNILQEYNVQSGANRKLYISEIDHSTLTIGERKYQYFQKMMNKPIDLANNY